LAKSTRLFQSGVNDIVIFHSKICGRLLDVQSVPVIQESDGIKRNALSLTIGIRQLLERRGFLDFELDF
jgi:hypothetical protein